MIDFFRLRDIREDNDINQIRMAEILGVNRSAYSLWELGINIIPLNYLAFFPLIILIILLTMFLDLLMLEERTT